MNELQRNTPVSKTESRAIFCGLSLFLVDVHFYNPAIPCVCFSICFRALLVATNTLFLSSVSSNFIRLGLNAEAKKKEIRIVKQKNSTIMGRKKEEWRITLL